MGWIWWVPNSNAVQTKPKLPEYQWRNFRKTEKQGPIYYHGLTLIPAWISNYIHYKMWDEITYPFLNFYGATVEV